MLFLQSIKAVCKSKLITSIIVIQLIVCFFTIIIAATTLKQDLFQLNSIKAIFDERKTLEITNNALVDVNYEDTDFQNKLYNYYCSLLKDKNVINGGFVASGTTVYGDLTQLSLINNTLEGNSNLILIDENFYKYMNKNLKVSSGRSFNIQDFQRKSTDKVPLLISKDLNKYINLGDVINNKYEVIGVIDRKSKLYYPNLGGVYEGVKQLSNTIITPINYKDAELKKEVVTDFSQETFITFKSEELSKEYLDKFHKDFSNKQLPLKVRTLQEDKNTFFNSVKYGIYLTIALSIILILFSFFGISGIILSTLMKRNKEFGVKLALGWTIKDICKHVFIEITFITTFSYAIISISSRILIKALFPADSLNIDIYIYIFTFIIVLLLTTLYSILPLKKIQKYNIVELIKDVR